MPNLANAPRLALRGVFAHWRNAATVEIDGFTAERPVSFDLHTGEWLALVGRNGVGKSTLLSSIAGTTPFIFGEIRLDDLILPPGDFGVRFLGGFALVSQHSQFGTESATPLLIDDAIDLAFSRRPGLRNSQAITNFSERIRGFQWMASDNRLNPQLFDLVTALLTVPRVLILDEIIGAWPPSLQTKDRYDEIRGLVPSTAVIFTDHVVNRALSICAKALVLRPKSKPQLVSEDGAKRQIEKEFTVASKNSTARTGEYLQIEDILRLDRVVSCEAEIAFRICRAKGRLGWAQREMIKGKWTFLNRDEPVFALSGGQRIMLAALLAHAQGLLIERDEFVHLDAENRKIVEQLFG